MLDIRIFTLNRPDAMNAVSAELAETFTTLMKKFESDDDAWIGIVTSSHPKVFCAGADLKSINAGKSVMTNEGGFAGFVNYPRKKPMIAAVDGMALAGGCEIVLACDLVVASRNKSVFGVPEVKRSLVAAAGGLYRLPQKLPPTIAMELLLTGDPMPAEKLASFGFINRLSDPGKSLEEAIKLAQQIEENAPLAVRLSRNVMLQSLQISDEKEQVKLSNQAIPMLAVTDDFKEGPKAFIEKRKPKWNGKKPQGSKL
jgi:enoyl-CoA hydratase